MEQEKPTKPETDRTFPEDDDTLYREMTVHMPRCYFPTSLGENSILKFAGEEFRRVKNIVCRRYNFNEDKYIRENAGYFPITSVHRDDLEGQGFDVEKISDDDMQNLAEKMADDYCEQLFWPSMEIIAGEILSFPKVKTKDIICPKCNSENIRYDIHESRFHCGECSLAWDDKLYALVEFPEESAPFEEEGTGYPAWGSGENGALYVPEEDYIRHTGKSPERDKCYRAVCWPDSQKYMGTKGCEPIQDENGIRDFGTSAYWVPLLLTEEAAERRMDKKKVPVCPECGGTDIDILSDEGVAVCNDCCLEWPYAED